MEIIQIISIVVTAGLGVIGGILIHLIKSNATLFEKKAEERFKAIDQRFEGVDKRIDKVERNLEKLTSEVHNLSKEVYKISGFLFAQNKK